MRFNPTILFYPRLFLACAAPFSFSTATGQEVDEAYGPVIAREVAAGLSQPLFVTSPPEDSRHLFILEKGGRIRILDRDEESLLSEPLLEISPISTNSERGLLGLAFHPEFSTNRYFYVNYTNSSGDTVVRRYRMESAEPPYAVEVGSALDLLLVDQPFANHNAGWIGFGPDGFLYIALGDGGSGDDPENNGQDTGTLLGSMLRLDVDGDDFPDDETRNYGIPAGNPFVGEDGRDEIWAYGLRNPWRNSFDRETGDLWIADVGQSNREEINFQPADSPGGENYGWRLREGTIATPTGGVGGERPPGNVDPIYEYSFSDGRKSVTGGYVYRGLALPQLRGQYFFSDYVADFVKSFAYEGDGSQMVDENDVIDWTAQFGNISNPASFGEDADGELYIASLSGKVFQITQSPWYLWRNRHFPADDIADPEVSGPAAAPLGDGVANLLKYALGLGPEDPRGDMPIAFAVETVDGERYLTLTVERDPAADDVELIIEATGTLVGETDWDSEAVVIIEDEPGRLRARDAVPVSEEGRRFLRLRAVADFEQ